MTNIDSAAEVLIHWADSLGGMAAIERDYDGDLTGGAEALADAGLLMPDLPEPDNTYPEWIAGGVLISPGSDAGEVTIEWEDREDTGRGTVGRILYLATDQMLAILAAASYTERNQE